MNQTKTGANGWAAKHRKNITHLRNWTAFWVATMALSTFGPHYLWHYATVPTVLGVLVNVGVGFGMIVANKRYLQGLDELQQKIFLQAGALTLGVGMVCGLAYELLENVRLISFEPRISHLVVLMSLTFLAGMIAGHRKYQ